MKDVMKRRHIGKEQGIQDKRASRNQDQRLFDNRYMVLTEDVQLPVNILELLLWRLVSWIVLHRRPHVCRQTFRFP